MMENQKHNFTHWGLFRPSASRWSAPHQSRRIRHNIGCWVGPNVAIKWGQAGLAKSILLADLVFQFLDPLLILVPLRSFPFQRQSGILEELLLPTMKQTGRQTGLFADFRDGDVLDQMSAQQFDLLICAPMSAFFLQESRSKILIGKTFEPL